MIESKQYFEVCCDKCGTRLELDAITAWKTMEDAEDVITYCDWQIDSASKVLCNLCKFNDDDKD